MVGYNIEVSQNFFMLEEAELPDQYSKVSKAIGQGEGMVVVEISNSNMDWAELSGAPRKNKKEAYSNTALTRENCAYAIGVNLAVRRRDSFK